MSNTIYDINVIRNIILESQHLSNKILRYTIYMSEWQLKNYSSMT